MSSMKLSVTKTNRGSTNICTGRVSRIWSSISTISVWFSAVCDTISLVPQTLTVPSPPPSSQLSAGATPVINSTMSSCIASRSSAISLPPLLLLLLRLLLLLLLLLLRLLPLLRRLLSPPPAPNCESPRLSAVSSSRSEMSYTTV